MFGFLYFVDEGGIEMLILNNMNFSCDFGKLTLPRFNISSC